MLSKCGKTLPYMRKKRISAGSCPADPKTIAIRTPRLERMSVNSGLNKQCEDELRIAAWKPLNSIYKVRGA